MSESFQNYFNYFTEIEEHFQKARGTALFFLSPLDWALIETWKGAGVPLEAVLRGVDEAFDKYDQRPSKSKKVNSLAYCSQATDWKLAPLSCSTSVNDGSENRRWRGPRPPAIASKAAPRHATPTP